MIERYTLPEMGAIWSEQAKFQSWLDVEIAATEANCELGRVPAEAVAETVTVLPGQATAGVVIVIVGSGITVIVVWSG